jgi:stalled ribosome alternative rescue factor ArfA
MAKKRITKKDLLKIEQAAVREERKEQGALDGRFREKVEKSKKSYTRKAKHKKKEP